MSSLSPLLALPYLQPAQAQKHVTHNEALRRLDMVVQLSVPRLGEVTPPADPAEGARHLVGVGASGAWAGQDNAVAVFENHAWQFASPAPGWIAYLVDDGMLAVFTGSDWVVLQPTVSEMLGINATADAQNRLAVAADAAIFTHDGSDHRLSINKANAAATGSLLFQSDYTGHAEMGLAGENAFAIKTSADGANWVTALRFDPATSAVSGNAVQQDSDDAAPGRLMLAEHGVLRTDVVGAVSQAGGLPTGAIIERTTTGSSNVVKWADGTVMMSRMVTVDINSADSQDFAYPDTIATVLSGGFIGGDANDANGVGSVPRREGLASLAVWTDTNGWRVRLPEVIDDYTISVMLTVVGLWY